MLGTFSDHAGLGPSRLGELQLGLSEVIEQAGGWVAQPLRHLRLDGAESGACGFIATAHRQFSTLLVA
jgi:hypothetical protein